MSFVGMANLSSVYGLPLYWGIMVIVEEAYLPLTLYVPDLSEAKFQEFCDQYADFRLEYTAEGELLIMPPTDRHTSLRNAKIVFHLMRWAEADGQGEVTESSGGFTLGNGARRSPDAAWSSHERFAIGACPEFVIELLSPSDRPKVTRAKMREWIDNGAELGWMINPATRTVTVFRAGAEPVEPVEMVGLVELAGEGAVAGFVLELGQVWGS